MKKHNFVRLKNNKAKIILKEKNSIIMMLTFFLLFLNIIKSWFSLDINVVLLLLLNILGFFLNIYVIIKFMKNDKKNILQLFVLILAILINFVPLADYKVYLEFSKTKDLRMKIINECQKSNENSFQIFLEEKYNDLSQDGILLNYDGKVFSFPIKTTVSIFGGCYIVYTPKKEDLTHYISRIYSIKELDENWYYIKS